MSKTGFTTPSLPLLLRLIARCCRRGRGSLGELGPKRALVMAFFIPLFCTGLLVHRAGFLLDDLFFRAYRRVTVRRPVFIVGVPRSGTTLLHRTIAADTDNFTSPRLWELIIAPSITERHVWLALARLDRRLGGPARRVVRYVEGRVLAPTQEKHPTGLLNHEEDEHFLACVLASVFLLIPFPFPELLWPLARFDVDMPSRQKARVMAFYKAMVQRHLYFHGQHLCYLSKNPANSGRVGALRDTFPDAALICCVRTPLSVLPSLLSLLAYPWQLFGNKARGTGYRDLVIEMVSHWYRHPMRCMDQPGMDGCVTVQYADLTDDPQGIVKALYHFVQAPMSEGFAAYLSQRSRETRTYRSSHRYCLEDYDLTEAKVVASLKDVFTCYGYPEET